MKTSFYQVGVYLVEIKWALNWILLRDRSRTGSCRIGAQQAVENKLRCLARHELVSLHSPPDVGGFLVHSLIQYSVAKDCPRRQQPESVACIYENERVFCKAHVCLDKFAGDSIVPLRLFCVKSGKHVGKPLVVEVRLISFLIIFRHGIGRPQTHHKRAVSLRRWVWYGASASVGE